MYSVISIACLAIVFRGGAAAIEKCCALDEYLKISNLTYECVEDQTKRLGIITNSADYLQNHADGECFDSTGQNIYKFEFSDGKIVRYVATGGEFYPKCCPLGHVYNPKKHSCYPKDNVQYSFITKDFVQVGLPRCKLIVDQTVQDSAVDIPSGGYFCIDQDEAGDLTRRNCEDGLNICSGIRCVKKCCPDGQSFINGPNCVDTYVHGLNLSFSDNIEAPLDPFAVISNRTCQRIYLMNENRYTFNLDRRGTFKYWMNTSNAFVYEPVETPHSYCVEHSKQTSAEGFFFFMCFPENPLKEKFQYTLWPKIISCVFLALTIVIYLVLNETRNIFGKILLNYCVATLLLFSLLVYAQLHLKPSDAGCELIGYFLIFFSTASFAWLNVMCCDIWFTFGYTKQSVGAHQRRRDIKRLFMYMAYGYGMPIILTLVIYGFATSVVLPYPVQPYVGTLKCFIEDRPGNYASLMFLRLPHLLIQIVNVFLFFKTITYCLRIKNEINKINDTTRSETKSRFKRDKERLSLILKLSIIMGVTYIFDVMSAFFNMSDMGSIPKYIEIVWDCINCLQGVFIFIIFICKKKTYYNILRKLNMSGRVNINTVQSTITSSTRMSMLNNSMPNNGKTTCKSK